MASLPRCPGVRASQPPSPHLLALQADNDEIQALDPRPDHFSPTLLPEDGALLIACITRYNSHYVTEHTFIKREPHRDELGTDMYGQPAVSPYISDRVRIDAASIQFLARHTTIPVPEFLGVWKQHGLWHMKTARVHGAIELQAVSPAQMSTAVAAVDRQLETDILPQLRRLRRRFMGCADPSLPVVPPHRCWEAGDTRVWSAMPRTSQDCNDDDDDYVFCHTDLGRQNILVDPQSFQIVCIVDWETAGFFPASWELPLWRAADHLERHKMTSAARVAELAAIKVQDPEAVAEDGAKP